MKRWTALSVVMALCLGGLGVIGLTISQSAAHVLSRILDRLLDRVIEKPLEPPIEKHDPPPVPNPYWSQPVWALDPSNTSGCASDNNTGTATTCGTPAHGPLLHWREVARRWGGGTVNFRPQPGNTDVTFNLISSQIDSSDPIIFDPVQLPGDAGATAGNTYLFLCAKGTGTTTTIATLTAKNISSNTQFNVTFAATPAINSMLQNTTHSSIAWIPNTGQASRISQPAAPITVSGGGSVVQVPAEVNTWAVSDNITVYALPAWTFAEVMPTYVGMAGDYSTVIQNCQIQEFAAAGVGPGDDKVVIGNGVQLVEDYIERTVNVQQAAVQYTCNSNALNSNMKGGFVGGPTVSTPPSGAVKSCPYIISSGSVNDQAHTGIGTSGFNNVWLRGGVFLVNGTTPFSPFLLTGYNYGGEIQVGISSSLSPAAGGILDLQNTVGAEAGQVWGPGKLNPTGGLVLYSAATLDAGELNVATLQNMGQTTSCCTTNTAAATTNCGTPLTSTNLGVLSCSDAGFNNQAFWPTGGGYQGF